MPLVPCDCLAVHLLLSRRRALCVRTAKTHVPQLLSFHASLPAASEGTWLMDRDLVGLTSDEVAVT